MNETDNISKQRDVAKVVIRENVIAINIYTKKKKKFLN